MVHTSHNSFLSSKDNNGFSHTLSIDPGVVDENLHSVTRLAKARSDGWIQDPRDGSVVRATFMSHKNCEQSSTGWADLEVEKRQKAQNAAMKFNNSMKHMKNIRCSLDKHSKKDEVGTNRDIQFQNLQTAVIDSVAFYGDNKPKKGETFIFTDKLEQSKYFLCAFGSTSECTKPQKRPKGWRKSSAGDISVLADKKRQSKSNRTRSQSEGNARYDCNLRCQAGNDAPSCCGKCGSWRDEHTSKSVSKISHRHLDAFVHHFYNQHDGTLAIDCLAGVYDGHGYTLTIPVIHSTDRRFGLCDGGVGGIQRVIENHVCNDLCQHFRDGMASNKSINDTSTATATTHDAVDASSVFIYNIQSTRDTPNVLNNNTQSAHDTPNQSPPNYFDVFPSQRDHKEYAQTQSQSNGAITTRHSTLYPVLPVSLPTSLPAHHVVHHHHHHHHPHQQQNNSDIFSLVVENHNNFTQNNLQINHTWDQEQQQSLRLR